MTVRIYLSDCVPRRDRLAPRDAEVRNAEMARLHAAGVASWVLARDFHRPRSSIEAMISQGRRARQVAEHAAALRQRMREANDLDRPWPLEDVAAALEMPSRADTTMRRHFESQGMKTLTLRQLMDAVAAEDPPERGNPVSRLFVTYQWRGVGKRTHEDILEAIWEADLGPLFHETWMKRLRKLFRELFGENCDDLRIMGASVRDLVLPP